MTILVPNTPRRRYAGLCAGVALALALVAAPGKTAQADPVSLSFELNPAPVERPTEGTALLGLYLAITIERGWEVVDFDLERAYNDQGQTLSFFDNPAFEFDLLDAESNPGFTVLTLPGAYIIGTDSPYGDFDRDAPDGPVQAPWFSLTVTRSTPRGPEFFTASASYSFRVLGPVAVLPEPASLASAAIAATAVGAFAAFRRRRRRRAHR